MTELPCENRFRSTLKCRKSCCTKKLKTFVRGTMKQELELSRSWQTDWEMWYTILCVMCGTPVNSINAAITCSDRCRENYWHYLNTGEDHTWFSLKKE